MSWPRFESCPRCGEEVLKARKYGIAQGRPFVLALPELLPLRRHRGGPKGERIDRGAWRVAVDWANGTARKLGAREARRSGEAIHRRHRCPA